MHDHTARAIAGLAVLTAGACVLAGCTTRAEITTTSPSPRATIVLKTPPITRAPVSEMPEPSGSPSERPSPVRQAACHPDGKRIAVRKPDARTTDRVGRAWRRIEVWLRKHAPRSAGSLRGPAPDQAIERAQTRLGRPLAPDLVASLRVHDGTGESTSAFAFPPFHVPATTRGIVSDWRTMCDVVEENGTTYPGDWRPEFTPFARANDGGVLYGDPKGQVGEYFAETGADTKGWPASYAALLEYTADLLETGRPGPSRFRAHVHDGVLDWKP